MRRKTVLCIFPLFLIYFSTFGQEILQSETKDVASQLTGNIRVDLFGVSSLAGPDLVQAEGDIPDSRSRKSPVLAAGMSLIIPGAGELYSESYWKAAAFFAAGATAWTIAYIQNKKGNDQTAVYQDFANKNWSVEKYATWTLDHATTLSGGTIQSTDGYQVLSGGNVNWAELNRLERDIGGWYSHTLPQFGEQQYYELIGKYPQFYQGWSDADASLSDYDAVSNRLNQGGTLFNYYSGERGKTNNFYNAASTAVTVAVVTHVLSAADGAWSASSYNSRFEAGVGFMKAPDGPLYVSYPAFQLAYRF